MKLTTILLLGAGALVVTGSAVSIAYTWAYGNGVADCRTAQAAADRAAIDAKLERARALGEEDAAAAGEDADDEAKIKGAIDAIPPNDAACLDASAAERLRGIGAP